jgi:hypothetical protein
MKKYSIILVLIALAVVTLACKTLTGGQDTPVPQSQGNPVQPTKPAEVSEPTIPPAVEEVPTQVPQEQPVVQPTPEPVQQATLAPQDTEAPVATAAPEVGTESWRVQPMPEAQLIVSDSTKDIAQDWLDIMEKQARNLSIPKGYYFEIYVLPKDTNWDAVKKHYNNLITSSGMKKAQDFVDPKGIGVLTWISPIRKTQKYLVQFNPGSSNNYMFIMYSNPK